MYMELYKTYQSYIETIEKDGKGFTAEDGTKYSKYRIKFVNYSLTFPAYVRKDLVLEVGDKISYEIILNRKKKFQLSKIRVISYSMPSNPLYRPY